MIFPLKEFFHLSTENSVPVPRHIGLRPIGEHLLLLPPTVLAGPHRLLDWVHPGWGRLSCQIFVSQFCVFFWTGIKKTEVPVQQYVCQKYFICVCSSCSFDENCTRTNCTIFIFADSAQTEYCPTFHCSCVRPFVCHRRDISHFSHI